MIKEYLISLLLFEGLVDEVCQGIIISCTYIFIIMYKMKKEIDLTLAEDAQKREEARAKIDQKHQAVREWADKSIAIKNVCIYINNVVFRNHANRNPSKVNAPLMANTRDHINMKINNASLYFSAYQ